MIFSSEPDQVIAYQRMEWIFVFNFNPAKSFTGYKIPAQSGKYNILFTTDDSEFGGQNRIDKSITYFSTSEGNISTLKTNYLQLYLPTRTALVLKNIPIKSVH